MKTLIQLFNLKLLQNWTFVTISIIDSVYEHSGRVSFLKDMCLHLLRKSIRSKTSALRKYRITYKLSSANPQFKTMDDPLQDKNVHNNNNQTCTLMLSIFFLNRERVYAVNYFHPFRLRYNKYLRKYRHSKVVWSLSLVAKIIIMQDLLWFIFLRSANVL